MGDASRPTLMIRGFAEIVRYAAEQGAARETLFGLSGFGDLILTCTSLQSRNLRHGIAIGAGQQTDLSMTVEGVMTAHAIAESLATRVNSGHPDPDADLPVTRIVSAVLSHKIGLAQAIDALLSRPLRQERDQP